MELCNIVVAGKNCTKALGPRLAKALCDREDEPDEDDDMDSSHTVSCSGKTSTSATSGENTTEADQELEGGKQEHAPVIEEPATSKDDASVELPEPSPVPTDAQATSQDPSAPEVSTEPGEDWRACLERELRLAELKLEAKKLHLCFIGMALCK